MSEVNNKKLAYFEGVISLICNILLAILKFWAGFVTGSVALISDAWHTLADSITSVVVIVGTKISSKPADDEHPFGHGRAEHVASLIIAVLLAVIAVNFLIEAVQKLMNHEEVVFGTLAIVATVTSIIVKEVLAQYAFWAAKKSGLNSVKADGWHHRSDAISSVIILAGIFMGKYFWWIDGVLGIIVSIMIFHIAYKIHSDTVNSILGEQPDDNLIEKIHDICKEKSRKDLRLHHFHIHKYGDHTEITFHIQLPGDKSLKEAHDIATQIEKCVLKRLNIYATIHMEPYNDLQTQVLPSKDTEI